MWFLWAGLSAALLAAAYALALRATEPSALFERAAVTVAVWYGLVVCSTWSAGALALLRPWPLAGFALAAAGLGAAAAGQKTLRSLPGALAGDLRATGALWSGLAKEPPFFLLAAGAVALWALSLATVLLFRTWNYDSTVYHAPLAHLFVQNGSTARLETHNIWMQGYPFAGSLLAVWNIIFPRDTLLDDAGQLPTPVLLVSVTAAWLTRLAVAPHRALAFGCVLLFMPTVFLQLGHGQVDQWCAGLFTLAVYALVFRRDRAGLRLFFACMALYAATKLSGLLHLLLVFPLFCWSVWPRARVHRGTVALELLAGALFFAAVGLPRYVENFLVTGTPTWPFSLRLPFGVVLPGATEAGAHFSGYAGYSGALFTSPDAVPAIFGSWYHLDPVFFPDVRTGGFGWVFALLVVPASAAVWLWWLRKRQWGHLLPLVTLAVMALAMPSAWWGRYTLPAAVVGLVCTGWGHAQLPRFGRAAAWLLTAVAWAGVAFAGVQLWRHRDLYAWPARLGEALAAPYPESAAVQITDWLWTKEAALYRERLPEGALVVHDESADFLSEYFPRRLQSRLEYQSSADPEAFVAAVYARHAALVGVRRDSPAEKALVARGASLLAPAARNAANLYTLGKVGGRGSEVGARNDGAPGSLR